jgi:transcriptional regulator with XRE-family HTH domain
MKAPRFYHGKPFPTGTLGDVIRAQRIEAGLTQKQLATASGVPRYWLGRWERDRALPNQAQWVSLGKVLKLPAMPG